jgi:hypothetical protein
MLPKESGKREEKRKKIKKNVLTFNQGKGNASSQSSD